jgi:hippurate hydrolase
MPVKNRIADFGADMAEWRHSLHRLPELGYDLPRTTAFVHDRLRSFGITDITTGIGRSGIVALIHGRSARSGRVIGLRADMDALPIHEATDLPYASTLPGQMHACGHDGHTAMLLGAARYLAETRNFDGTVALIFQPAEETDGGALAMCQDGLMDRFDIHEVYGLHNMPGLPVGAFATRAGALQASCDDFEITVKGRGGHAAIPHETVDTTLVAAHIVVALQSFVSRNVDPLKQVVLTVGTFKTDSNAANIIPDRAVMQGTLRSLDPAYRALAETRLADIASHTARAFGAEAKLTWHPGYPVTINSPDETAHAIAAARAISDDVNPDTPPIMPAEDFSYMLERRPGAYMFMGNGNSAMCHHPAYNFNDAALPIGSSYFVELIERRLPLMR